MIKKYLSVSMLALVGLSSAYAQKDKEDFPLTQDSKRQEGVDYGEWINTDFKNSKIYPETSRKVNVYVPAQYDGKTPACVFVLQDGGGFNADVVVSNLLAKKEIPVIIVIGITPGIVTAASDPQSPRANRTYEYDTPSGRYSDFLLQEIFPFVETLQTKDGKKIVLSKSGNDRMIGGGSSGAAAAYNAAFSKPEEFSRVFSAIGSYTGLRGSYANSTMLHKVEPKNLRLFLQSGTHDMWTAFGDWWSANNAMVRALEFAGYDFKYVFGEGRHSGAHGAMLLPEAMRYLWAGYPEQVAPTGNTRNHFLNQILIKKEPFKFVEKDASARKISAIDGDVFISDGKTSRSLKSGKKIDAVVLCETLEKPFFLVQTDGDKICRMDSDGKIVAHCGSLKAKNAVPARDGRFYISGSANGARAGLYVLENVGISALDTDLKNAGALAISPNDNWLYVFEEDTRRGYSYRNASKPDAKQDFFFLHLPDECDSAESKSALCDDGGRIYVATSAGIQVCDYNGRSTAILVLPKGEKPVSMAFAGNELWVLGEDGNVYVRKMKSRAANLFAPIPKIKVNAG